MSDTTPDRLKGLLEFIGKGLVSHPESFAVEHKAEAEGDQFLLTVHEEDFGQIIGRQGRTARALRAITKAGAARSGRRASVEIVE
jgi:predicted RNA-binding protein YlqC (UPF0109 family)